MIDLQRNHIARLILKECGPELRQTAHALPIDGRNNILWLQPCGPGFAAGHFGHGHSVIDGYIQGIGLHRGGKGFSRNAKSRMDGMPCLNNFLRNFATCAIQHDDVVKRL